MNFRRDVESSRVPKCMNTFSLILGKSTWCHHVWYTVCNYISFNCKHIIDSLFSYHFNLQYISYHLTSIIQSSILIEFWRTHIVWSLDWDKSVDMIDHLARTHLQYTNSPKKIINKLLSNDTLHHSHHLVVASDSTVVSFQNFWQTPCIFIFDISFSFQHLVFEFSVFFGLPGRWPGAKASTWSPVDGWALAPAKCCGCYRSCWVVLLFFSSFFGWKFCVLFFKSCSLLILSFCLWLHRLLVTSLSLRRFHPFSWHFPVRCPFFLSFAFVWFFHRAVFGLEFNLIGSQWVSQGANRNQKKTELGSNGYPMDHRSTWIYRYLQSKIITPYRLRIAEVFLSSSHDSLSNAQLSSRPQFHHKEVGAPQSCKDCNMKHLNHLTWQKCDVSFYISKKTYQQSVLCLPRRIFSVLPFDVFWRFLRYLLSSAELGSVLAVWPWVMDTTNFHGTGTAGPGSSGSNAGLGASGSTLGGRDTTTGAWVTTKHGF